MSLLRFIYNNQSPIRTLLMLKIDKVYLFDQMISGKRKEQNSDCDIYNPCAQRKAFLHKTRKPGI